MDEPFLGSEALAAGRLTRHALRSRHRLVYPGVYLPAGKPVTPVNRAQAAWLWSRRRAVPAGRSAAALHGAKWLDAGYPAELHYANRRPPPGIRTWADELADDEVTAVGGIPVTTPLRTAFDIASRYRLDAAVATIDALARSTRLKVADIELFAQRYPGHRGIRNARAAIGLVDPGAESPRETWLRLLLIRAGFPRPTTQIPVYGKYRTLVAVVDMGWEEIKVGVDYEGDHHRRSARQFNHDIRRAEALAEMGWIDVRITKDDTVGGIVGRVGEARARRV
ncbi:hypothetical protein [Mycobacterium sp. UM_Kg1]|uniref:hypothetical protein n=1 Tax=Mycobacterium sp. UM_Kg1 TaxID=1545691 RepID=UPI00061AC1DB|nr:hypothetical protein [Mycobacterium sp. UM_Kg1]